jgi:lambda repressor-like predicted transcriptional regulator
MTETDTAPRVPQPEDIEALAAKRGISVVALCREAGVSRLAFRR